MDLAAVVDIAERAGRLQVQRRPSLVVKGTKAHVNDLVSDVDLASEQLIGDALAALWPDDVPQARAEASTQSGLTPPAKKPASDGTRLTAQVGLVGIDVGHPRRSIQLPVSHGRCSFPLEYGKESSRAR